MHFYTKNKTKKIMNILKNKLIKAFKIMHFKIYTVELSMFSYYF